MKKNSTSKRKRRFYFACFHIVTQKNGFLLTNKLTTFSTAKETKNETKKITDSESTSKKGEVTLDSFLNFTYSAVICI